MSEDQARAIIRKMTIAEIRKEFEHYGYDPDKFTLGSSPRDARKELIYALEDYELFEDFVKRHQN